MDLVNVMQVIALQAMYNKREPLHALSASISALSVVLMILVTASLAEPHVSWTNMEFVSAVLKDAKIALSPLSVYSVFQDTYLLDPPVQLLLIGRASKGLTNTVLNARLTSIFKMEDAFTTQLAAVIPHVNHVPMAIIFQATPAANVLNAHKYQTAFHVSRPTQSYVCFVIMVIMLNQTALARNVQMDVYYAQACFFVQKLLMAITLLLIKI